MLDDDYGGLLMVDKNDFSIDAKTASKRTACVTMTNRTNNLRINTERKPNPLVLI